MTLKDEIAKPIYDGMTDAEIAAALNGQTVVPEGTVDVSTLEIKKLLLRRFEYGTIKDAGRQSPSAQIRAAAISMTTVCEDPEIRTIGTSDKELLEKITAMLSAFIGASLISQRTMDDLLAMTVPQPVLNWQPPVTARDVWIARGQPGLGVET